MCSRSRSKSANRWLCVLAFVALVGGIASYVVIYKIHQIDGYDTRKLNIKNEDYKVYLCDYTGKMSVEYTGTDEYGVVVVGKDGERKSNSYVIYKGNKDIIGFTYGDGEYNIKVCKETDGSLEELENYIVTLKTVDKLGSFNGNGYYISNSSKVDNIVKLIDYNTDEEFVYGAYNYLVFNIEYNDSLAELVKSGKINTYKPDIDTIIETGKGICIDQASLLASMVRSKGIPARIVVGYNEVNEYHAWIEAYINGNWLLYDSTMKRTFKDEKVKEYKIEKYY